VDVSDRVASCLTSVLESVRNIVSATQIGMSPGATLEAGTVSVAAIDWMTNSRSDTSSLGPALDEESRVWLARLRAAGPVRDEARTDLRDLLLRAARFEVHRRGSGLPHVNGGDIDDLARQSADDALVAILAKLDDFRGEARFTTWAYKFVLLEAGVKLRRRAWQGREIQLEAEHWDVIAAQGATPAEAVEANELIAALRDAIDRVLTAHQRRILVAITLNDVPIDVLAERLNTTRGALYKTLHDARRKLRLDLSQRGLDVGSVGGPETL
jgi:RNA polymerase sigma-70 factor (ECF subfamily)